MPRPPQRSERRRSDHAGPALSSRGDRTRFGRARKQESSTMSVQPLTSVSVPLQFTDSASCKGWFEQLTLSNVRLPQQALTSQLGALGAAHLPPLDRLKILEALREP